jgi:hypothetical protein
MGFPGGGALATMARLILATALGSVKAEYTDGYIPIGWIEPGPESAASNTGVVY